MCEKHEGICEKHEEICEKYEGIPSFIYGLWDLGKISDLFPSIKSLRLEKILSFTLGSGTWKNSDL